MYKLRMIQKKREELQKQIKELELKCIELMETEIHLRKKILDRVSIKETTPEHV